jgi:hypothetical protein
MPGQAQEKLSAEVVRRMAADVVGLPLPEAMIEPLRDTLEGLYQEIAAIPASLREGMEPLSQVSIEEWPT